MQRNRPITSALGAASVLMIGGAGAVRAQLGTGTGTVSAKASEQATRKAQREIQAIIQIQCTAMEHKDIDAMDRPYTDDYHSDDTTGGGPINKASRDETTKELIAAAQTIHVQATISGVQLSADGKTATMIEKTHLVFTSYPRKNEKSHTVVLDGSASEVWVKVSPSKANALKATVPKITWLKRSRKSLAMTEAIDGVPYKPAAAAPAASEPSKPTTPPPTVPPPTAPANSVNPPVSTDP